MTIDEVTLDRPKIGTDFSVICGFCRLRHSRFAMKFSAEIFAPASEWILGIRSLLLTVLLYHLQMGLLIHHLFVSSRSHSR